MSFSQVYPQMSSMAISAASASSAGAVVFHFAFEVDGWDPELLPEIVWGWTGEGKKPVKHCEN